MSLTLSRKAKAVTHVADVVRAQLLTTRDVLHVTLSEEPNDKFHDPVGRSGSRHMLENTQERRGFALPWPKSTVSRHHVEGEKCAQTPSWRPQAGPHNPPCLPSSSVSLCGKRRVLVAFTFLDIAGRTDLETNSIGLSSMSRHSQCTWLWDSQFSASSSPAGAKTSFRSECCVVMNEKQKSADRQGSPDRTRSSMKVDVYVVVVDEEGVAPYHPSLSIAVGCNWGTDSSTDSSTSQWDGLGRRRPFR